MIRLSCDPALMGFCMSYHLFSPVWVELKVKKQRSRGCREKSSKDCWTKNHQATTTTFQELPETESERDLVQKILKRRQPRFASVREYPTFVYCNFMNCIKKTWNGPRNRHIAKKVTLNIVYFGGTAKLVTSD